MASSYFDPNAGRPAIRGQDGDRIRILQNGGASIDASSLSYDHNTPIDPLSVERVEVLRGPAALLYGGSALGGVVNVIDNRIPEAPVAGPEGGATGRTSVGYATGNREKSGAAMVEAGNDRYALHVDAFSRNAGDTRAPEDLACERPGSPEMARRICNSANRANGGAVGGTVFFNRGYLGASASSYSSRYGTVAEDNVHIGMKASRFALKGQYQPASGPVDQLDVQWSRGNYHHTEFEDEEAGTIFRNHGNDLRLQARHRAWGALRGVWGLQWEDTAFSATGEEAFMPPSRTRSLALFAHDELATGWGELTFGARAEDVRVRSSGDENGDEDEARFAAGQRRFHPVSAAFGVLVNVAPRWQLTGNLAAQHRVPEGDRATGAYTLWNAAFTYRQKLGRAQLNWFARIDNLTNQLAYSATSVLTTTAFPKAPLPGRSLRVGVQATF